MTTPPLNREELVDLIVMTSGHLTPYLAGRIVDRALLCGMSIEKIIRAHALGGPDCIIVSAYAQQISDVYKGPL